MVLKYHQNFGVRGVSITLPKSSFKNWYFVAFQLGTNREESYKCVD